MSIGNCPESLSQAMLVGIMLVGRLAVLVWFIYRLVFTVCYYVLFVLLIVCLRVVFFVNGHVGCGQADLLCVRVSCCLAGDSKEFRQNIESEHKIMGWIAVSAEGSQGKGSPKRNVFFTDTGIKVNCEKPTTC